MAPNLKNSKPIVVGIHVLRGDLTTKIFYDQGFRLPGIVFFQNAVNYFKEKYSIVIFSVATNGRTWDQQHLLGSGPSFIKVSSLAQFES